jgi:hypothetical protein
MINVLGENYYIDLDRLEDYIEIVETIKTTENANENSENVNETRVNLVKLEFVKMLLNTILTEEDDGIDEKLGMKSSTKTTIPFRLAFNSLLNKKIITYY